MSSTHITPTDVAPASVHDQPTNNNPYAGMDISMCPVHGKSAQKFVEMAATQPQQQPPVPPQPVVQQSPPAGHEAFSGMDISMCPVHGKSAEVFARQAQHINSQNFLQGAERFPAAVRPSETTGTDVVGDVFPDSKPIFGQRMPLSTTPAKSSIPKSTRSTGPPGGAAQADVPQVNPDLKQAATSLQNKLVCTSDEANTPSTQGVVIPGKDFQEDTWSFPSQQRFYNAMKKKGWDPNELDIPYIVSIHNTVNQRVWSQIMKYESYHQKSCPEPSLLRFQGRPNELSPKAQIMSTIGYSAPYDRHDWIIDRCGTDVRYIIDFYDGPRNPHTPVSTHIDARPALDSPGAAIDRLRRAFDEWFEF